MAEYEDKEIICRDCHKPFVFEAGEQQFYAEKGFTPPKSCKPCRDERKAQRDGGGPPRRQEHADDYAGTPSYEGVWEDDKRTRGRRRRRR